MWLGDEKDNSNLAMDILIKCQNTLIDGKRAQENGSWTRARHEQLGNEMVRLMRAEEYDKHWDAVAVLFVREYWTRVWILQEVLLSADATVCCGKKRVRWLWLNSLLVTWSNSLSEIARPPAQRAFAVGSWPRRLAELSQTRKTEELNLMDLLLASRQRWATRKQDHVFAILGLLSARERETFRFDYKQVTKDVYLNILEYFIQKDGTLDVLTVCKGQDLDEYERVKDLERQFEQQEKRREAFMESLGGTTPSKRSDDPPPNTTAPEPSCSTRKPGAEDYSISNPNLIRDFNTLGSRDLEIEEKLATLTSNVNELMKAMRDINISDRVDRGTTPWPTWIPDWTHRLGEESYSECLYLLHSKPRPTFYRAAGDSKAQAKIIKEKRLLLSVKGVLFDKVKSVSPYCYDNTKNKTEDELHAMIVQDYWRYVVRALRGNTGSPSPYGNDVRSLNNAYHQALILGRNVIGDEENFEANKEFYSMFWKYVELNSVSDDLITNPAYTFDPKWESKLLFRVQARIQQLKYYMKYKSRFFATDKGYLGRGPVGMKEGDVVCLLFGGRVPFVLREDEDGYYRLVGESCRC